MKPKQPVTLYIVLLLFNVYTSCTLSDVTGAVRSFFGIKNDPKYIFEEKKQNITSQCSKSVFDENIPGFFSI